jgi:hypothetical protein
LHFAIHATTRHEGLPDPCAFVSEIVEDFEGILEQFRKIAVRRDDFN